MSIAPEVAKPASAYESMRVKVHNAVCDLRYFIENSSDPEVTRGILVRRLGMTQAEEDARGYW
jgi:hypothetical protein